MHPFILEQLAAEHVKDQLAAADDARRARQARRARSQASRQRNAAQPAGSAGRTRTAPSTPRSRPPGRRQRGQVRPQAPPPLLIRVARALRAVHQELEIASECLLRPGPAPQADPLAWVRTRSGYCLAGRWLPDLPYQ